jgi:hypothetical protein
MPLSWLGGMPAAPPGHPVSSDERASRRDGRCMAGPPRCGRRRRWRASRRGGWRMAEPPRCGHRCNHGGSGRRCTRFHGVGSRHRHSHSHCWRWRRKHCHGAGGHWPWWLAGVFGCRSSCAGQLSCTAAVPAVSNDTASHKVRLDARRMERCEVSASLPSRASTGHRRGGHTPRPPTTRNATAPASVDVDFTDSGYELLLLLHWIACFDYMCHEFVCEINLLI